MQSLDLAVLDNLRGEVHLISHADLADPNGIAAAEARLDAMVDAINRPGKAKVRSLNAGGARPEVRYHYPEAAFKADVEKIREYIMAGDCMQVVPSQRMSCAFPHPPLDYYRALRITNPSPYMYLLDLDDFHIMAPRRKYWRANRAIPSPCARWPARANAAKRQKKTWRWKKNCWRMKKKSPNT